MARLLPLLALAAALAGCSRDTSPLGPDLVTTPRVGAVVFTVNSFDGTPDVSTFTFGPPGSTPVLSLVDGVGGGRAQGVSVTAPAAGGYAGGFGYTRAGSFAAPGGTLTLYVRPDADEAFTLGLRVQDDDDGDGVIARGAGDAIVADDEAGLDVVIRPGGDWRRLTLSLADLADLNPGVGNDTFDPVRAADGGNGGLVSLALLVLEAPAGARLAFGIDEVTFNDGNTAPAVVATPSALTFSARVGQTSAPQTLTLSYANVTALPALTVPAGFTATLVSQAGSVLQGSQTYAVTFVAPATAGTTTGTLAVTAGDATASVALTGTATAGPGQTRPYATFEANDFSRVVIFSQTNAGIGVTGTDGAPETGGTRALRFSLTPAAAGGFAGFVVPPQAGPPFDATGTGFFSFWLRTSVTSANVPLTLEVNLHEDADANGSFNGAVDDEYQATVAVTPQAGWTLVTLPLSAFTDDNAVFVGANNGFTYARLHEIVFAIAGPAGPAYTIDVDDLRFTEFAP